MLMEGGDECTPGSYNNWYDFVLVIFMALLPDPLLP
ncbi:hypothetical protein ES703_55916 [subsurface metagenome]